HRVRAFDTSLAQLAERVGERGWVFAHFVRQVQLRVGGAGADALDARRGVAVDDRAVLGEGERTGGVLDRLPVRILGAALDIADLLLVECDRHAQLAQRKARALAGQHAAPGRVDVLYVAGACRRQVIAGGALHVDDPPRRQVALERAGGLLPDL